MSNISVIIEERPADIGNFLVGRLLPFRDKRMVGPYIFIDHMGPAALNDHQNIDVPPHPHIGLSTLTYLFEGSIRHRDSLGTDVEIHPGAVNWMTAEAKDIPHWEKDGVSFRLIAGEAFGRKSPVAVFSKQFFLEIKSTEARKVNIGAELFGESGMYILEGSIKTEAHEFKPKQLLVAKQASLCEFTMAEHTTVYVFGGEAFAEERFIYWNFVASSREKIEAAKQKWLNQEFVPVPGEIDFVPLPKQNYNPAGTSEKH
eukprot:gene12237-14960_t